MIVSFPKILFSIENHLFGHSDVRFKWKMVDTAGKYTSRSNSFCAKKAMERNLFNILLVFYVIDCSIESRGGEITL